MLMNTVEMGERPDELAICGGTGRAARNWACYDAIVRSLKSLENDETLLIQSGKPVGIFRTHEYAPRVLIANANLVGHWSSWEKFNELERAGLTMYGQATAGSWIYLGSQGMIQGTFETFAAVADKHFGGELAGKLIVSGGMGGMGGAQPMAATMAGACFLGVEVDAERIKRRLRAGYLDFMVNSLDEALRILKNAIRKKENISVGLIGNCADVIPELADRGVLPDILTDQTSAHDPLNGYVPNGMPLAAAVELRQRDPKAYAERSLAAIVRHVEAMLRLQKMGAVAFDYRQQPAHLCLPARCQERLRYPGICCRLPAAAVRRRTGVAALGGALGRCLRHRGNRRPRVATVPAGPSAEALDRSCPPAHKVPGTAGARLLAGMRRTCAIRVGNQ